MFQYQWRPPDVRKGNAKFITFDGLHIAAAKSMTPRTRASINHKICEIDPDDPLRAKYLVYARRNLRF